jgi:MFS family permease
MWPTCFNTYVNCEAQYVQHLSGYIQIVGIIAGMIFWGPMGDIIGRKWGSRCVAVIFLTGVIMLTFTAFAQYAYAYFVYFLISQTWYVSSP